MEEFERIMKRIDQMIVEGEEKDDDKKLKKKIIRANWNKDKGMIEWSKL